MGWREDIAALKSYVELVMWMLYRFPMNVREELWRKIESSRVPPSSFDKTLKVIKEAIEELTPLERALYGLKD